MNQEDFTCFFQYRSYDIISNGQFKKKLTHSKENGDFWAIDIHNKQNKIQQCIKQIQNRVHAMGKNNIAIACRNVINCAQPPVKIFLGFSTCFVTGLQSDKCLDLSKNGKKSHDIHIHPKFAYFFMFLWYACKLEYVIRACAKSWMDNTFKEGIKVVDQAIYDRYTEENKTLCDSLYAIFNKAVKYVQSSLDRYESEFLIKPILQPPVEYWEKRKRGRLDINTDSS
jgi:hypothetical protein